MIARLLGLIAVIVPIGIVVALFWYWLARRRRRDALIETEARRKLNQGDDNA